MADEKYAASFREAVHSVGRNVKFRKVHKSVFKAVFPFLFKKKALTAKEERRLKEEFDKYDRSKDGFISLQEMMSVLRTTGHDDKRLEETFKNLDSDGDGRLNFEEFKTLKSMLARN